MFAIIPEYVVTKDEFKCILRFPALPSPFKYMRLMALVAPRYMSMEDRPENLLAPRGPWASSLPRAANSK